MRLSDQPPRAYASLGSRAHFQQGYNSGIQPPGDALRPPETLFSVLINGRKRTLEHAHYFFSRALITFARARTTFLERALLFSRARITFVARALYFVV